MKKLLIIIFALFFLFPPTVFAADTYSFSNFRGANFIEGDNWYGNVQDAEISASAAEKMGLNTIRLNVRLNQLTSDDIFVTNLVAVMDVFAKQNIKVLLVLGGYVAYDIPCSGYSSYLSVAGRATKVITALKGHPALFAWELMNEALSANDKNCSADQIKKAVNSMYTLVRSIDSTSPITVSEAFYWWDLSTWKSISTFSSFHWYPFGMITSSPVSDADIVKLKADLSEAIKNAKALVAPLPLVVSEFGIQSPTTVNEEDQSKVYKAIYEVIKTQNVGGAFWTISVDDPSGQYTIIKPDGTFKHAAYIVRSQYVSNAIIPLLGDINGDGKVDVFDYNLIVSNFKRPYTIYDYNTLINNFGK